MPDNGTIEVVFAKPGVRYSETQLTGVIYATNQKKIVISNQDTVEVNNELKKLPYQDGSRREYPAMDFHGTAGLSLADAAHGECAPTTADS
ncbi:mucin-6-like [Hemitrygon akajei]|uniref:mucin-6-like n=1 Tax=Hemitrygon akajei TaxID=2704970 RepID=UPI003BF97085